MSERHSNEFDDEQAASRPPYRGDTEDGAASSATAPVPPEPAAEQPWPPPPLAPGFGVPPSVSPPPATLGGYASAPDRPGAHRTPTDAETTSIVDRHWLSEQLNRDPQEHGLAGRPEPQNQRPWGDGRAELEESPDGPTQSFGLRGAPRPEEQSRPGWPAPPTDGWPAGSPQQPPYGGSGPAGEYAGPGQWSSAQGSAATWNYVDNIRSSELVPTRRIPPSRGWRKVLYKATFTLINPGQSPDERYEDELVAKVRSLLRGTYKIGVLGKGGVGKSTIAAGVGSIFAELRQDDRVVAVDADTAFGKLALRIDPRASGSYWELAADRNLNTFADMRSRVGSNPAGLFVLGGAPETARRRVLDPAIYRAATTQLNRHFTLSIVDCGSTMDSPVTREVLNDVDALIVVSSPWFDGASAAGQTLEWLANGGYTALLHRTVVVVNDSDGHAEKRELKLLAERFGKHGQKVIQMPYDQHLRPGGVIDVKNEINALTRRRMLELAAECAEHFGTTSDRPSRGMATAPPAPGPAHRRGM